MPIQKTCEQCGGPFKVKPSHSYRRFCGQKCYGKWRTDNIRGERNHKWKPKVVKECWQCGETFEVKPSDADQKFCSKECLDEWHTSRRAKIVCEMCGKVEYEPPWRAKIKRFCSEECKGKWHSENFSGENHPSRKSKGRKTQLFKSCKKCGAKFRVYPSNVNQRLFCGEKCSAKWWSERKVIKTCVRCGAKFRIYSGRERKRRFCSCQCYRIWRYENRKVVESVCEVCGKKYDVPRIIADKRRTCSRECMGELYSKRREGPVFEVGEKNPNWRGGISFEPYGVEFNESLKEQVRIRDGRTCQECGRKQHGKRLSVHHIDYDKKNSCPSNLISLCHGCHSKTNADRAHWQARLTVKMEDMSRSHPISHQVSHS